MAGPLHGFSMKTHCLIGKITLNWKKARGPMPRSRLHGCAERFKHQLDRDRLKQEDGLQYYLKTMRQFFVRNAYHVFMYRFLQFMKQYRGKQHWIPWEARIKTQHMRLLGAWMDLLEVLALLFGPKTIPKKATLNGFKSW